MNNATIVVIVNNEETYSGIKNGYITFLKNNSFYDKNDLFEIEVIIDNIMKIHINNNDIITLGITKKRLVILCMKFIKMKYEL